MSTARSSLALALGVALVLGAAWLVGFAIAAAPHVHVDPFDPSTATPYREDP